MCPVHSAVITSERDGEREREIVLSYKETGN